MNVETRQLAHRVSLALQKLEGAVLSCLPPEQRREVALSPAFCEFRAALQAISDPQPRAVLVRQDGAIGCSTPLQVTGAGDALMSTLEHSSKVRNVPVYGTWQEEAAEMGLEIRRPSDHQVQFMQDGKVLADWWPSKGTTMMDGKRGPRCGTGEAIIAWLKEV